jgi:flavin-dependent dehydrogenase
MGLHKADNWLALLDAAPNTKKLTHGTVRVDADIRSFPAPSYCLDAPCGDGWLAIGDAASAYDPIISQGIIKSLANALLAANTVQHWIAGDTLDPGRFSHTIMEEYRQYLAMRRYFYQLEGRWGDSGFWRRYRV